MQYPRSTVQYRRRRERQMVAFGLVLASISGFFLIGFVLWPH